MDTYTDASSGMDNLAFHHENADVTSPQNPDNSFRSEPDNGCSSSKRAPLAKETIATYLTSQKGRELCMGTSLMVAVTMIVIGLTLLLSLHLSPDVVLDRDITTFLLLMFSMSSSSILVMVVLSNFNILTNDDHYKDQHRTAFLRGGMTVLATGGIVYYSVEVLSMAHDIDKCPQALNLAMTSAAIIFTALQVAFLLRYSKVRINRDLATVTMCRFMLMFIIATNSIVWLCIVIKETVEELEHSVNGTGLPNASGYMAVYPGFGEFMHQKMSQEECQHSEMVQKISPFLYPLLIEFCVVASTMTLAIWEKCGVGLERMQRGDSETSTQGSGTLDADPERRISLASSVNSSMNDVREDVMTRSGFYNSNFGFVCGWLCLVGSVVSIMIVLLNILDNTHSKRSVTYAINIFLTVCGIIVIPFAVHKMSRMRFKDEQIRRQRKGDRSLVKKPRLHRKMDRNLLTMTFLSLLAYKMMSTPVAWEKKNVVIFIDAITSIIHGFMQMAFLNWYACQKRAKTNKERTDKPGRQFLELLRMLNLSLWLVNTFLLKEAHAKDLHEEVYGPIPWVIISNIFQPLSILYYFHSMACAAEVIVRSYTDKYVGIARPTKPDILSAENAERSVVSFVDGHSAHIP